MLFFETQTKQSSNSLVMVKMKYIILSLTIVISGVSVAESPKTNIIHLPDGKTIENKVTTIEQIPQKIRILNNEELQHIEELSSQSKKFVNYYFPEIKSPDLKDYDLAFHAWQISKNKTYSSQLVVELIGAYLGEKCVKDLNMEWIEVTDEYGTDLAVRGKNSEVTSFPFSVVSKRIENNEHEFIYAVFHTVQQMLKDSAYKER